jgi:hypothetical protein
MNKKTILSRWQFLLYGTWGGGKGKKNNRVNNIKIITFV